MSGKGSVSGTLSWVTAKDVVVATNPEARNNPEIQKDEIYFKENLHRVSPSTDETVNHIIGRSKG